MEAFFGKKKERAHGGALVLYTTRHGQTQRFAESIAQPLDALVKDAGYASLEKAKTYDAIVLGCCVYAGKIKGMDFFAEHAADLADKRLILFTCGLYDPQIEENRRALDAQIEAALGGAAKHVQVFHLRGGVRWQSLGLVERVMLKTMIAGMKKKPAQERTLIEQQMIDSEGGTIDFSDEADLSGIVRAARFGREA
ncbi:MAG: flavodoxin domain-containing protein [Eubacteriales bacterium]|nr:flavodoxin domain-containing protein [Eubacteriales bacterium]